MLTPFNNMVIPGPGFINPMPSMPAEQFGRSIDSLPGNQPGGGGGGGGMTPPLWLTAPDTTHLKVQFGQVNGITPSGGWTGGTDVGVNVLISGYSNGTYNIYMALTLASSGLPSAVQVTANTSAVPTDTSSAAYRLIGQSTITGGVVVTVSPSMAWSQEFVTCGRDPADPTTTPGTYYWELS